MSKEQIKALIKERVLIIDGAMGTQIQSFDIADEVWEGKEGCNELLNVTAPDIMTRIHRQYFAVGGDLIKTNTFGAFPWVLDEYGIGDRSYELARAGAQIVKDLAVEFSTPEKPRFVLGSIGPGTKLPSLGHITYDEMLEGYKICALGLIDGGCDVYLLETAQDPLQIKAAIHACEAANKERGVDLPIMVSVTIEMSGTMLIGTDATTIATILEPFDILSLGFNCGTGPEQVKAHVKTLSEVWNKPISVHSNAGLPQNKGGYTYYPMGPREFTDLQYEFLDFDGVSFLGGCCGTTPQHIKALAEAVEEKQPTPKAPSGTHEISIASLFTTVPLMQEPAPFLMGERSNATGSKAFRELLTAEDYEGTMSVAQQQVRAGAHGLDVSVGFAGRDETKDMQEVIGRYTQHVSIPLMPDSTQVPALEEALKRIGGKAIINSVNLEDGEDKFDQICQLAKRYGASLVALTIDEVGMAKTKQQKLDIALRMYDRAVNKHGINPRDLVFDLLTFTVGSGDQEYFTAAIETIDAIRELRQIHPEVGAVLGLSNISFGLAKESREYLNSVFLHHCVEAGLTMAIVNAKNIIPMHKMKEEDIQMCEDLLFNKRDNGHDPLMGFINYFSDVKKEDSAEDDAAYNALSTREKIAKLLLDGDKERMLPLVLEAKEEIAPEVIVNEVLIDAMKVVGELFGSGQMQLPFVLQSAETMKAAVDTLNPYLPKIEKKSETTLVLGTVKGDVHDVGKNLVDIILSNNGFKVINLGIKVELQDFINAVKEHDADAIGMSGLLVKSTLVMKENLEAMRAQGVETPILLGGAALTHNFIEEYCRTNYDGAIFYCKDAFDGITAMSRIEKGNLDTKLHDHVDANQASGAKKEKKVISLEDVVPATVVENVPVPPFWGDREFSDYDTRMAFDWINERLLFKQRWGYKSKNLSDEAYEEQLKTTIRPNFERLKQQFVEENLFQPKIVYGYYPVRAVDDTLYIFDPKEGFSSNLDASTEAVEAIKDRAIASMQFPRQQKSPHRALSDYFRSDRHDVMPLTVVTAGERLSEYEKELYDKGEFSEYYLVHGLGVELAEALAEIVHKQVRVELGLLKNETPSLYDVNMRSYHGKRYSPGYPACPDLELNGTIFTLLKPERFGIELSETFQIVPEQSTAAIVVHNDSALYYTTD
jgi:5-methyltetrahydrofolate--homocysteine methyltransferase